MNKIIFLDVDGPLIPGRMYRTSRGTHRKDENCVVTGYHFDPVAVSMLHKICGETGAKIVWNTAHNARGLSDLWSDADANGLPRDLFHEDAQTAYPGGYDKIPGSALLGSISRILAITRWLNEHPHTEAWVAIDDELIDTPRLIHIDFEMGMTVETYDLALSLLNGAVNEETSKLHEVSA